MKFIHTIVINIAVYPVENNCSAGYNSWQNFFIYLCHSLSDWAVILDFESYRMNEMNESFIQNIFIIKLIWKNSKFRIPYDTVTEIYSYIFLSADGGHIGFCKIWYVPLVQTLANFFFFEVVILRDSNSL